MDDVDGFSCWQDGRPMIFIVAKQSAARERLNLAHEVLHLIAHAGIAEDSLEEKSDFKAIEEQAFAFGGALLAPRSTYGREVFSFNVDHFVALKRRWGFSIAGQGARCLLLGIMDEGRYLQFRKNLSWNRILKTEPLDDSVPCETPLMLRQAIEILTEHKVITGWQLAEKFGLPPSKMTQFTALPESYFLPPEEPTPTINILA
jgi:Zn-dependent peptidase ImmA (M78 family)